MSRRPKQKAKVPPPTDAEFNELDVKQGQHRFWVHAGTSWGCHCCGRTKREICRKSNKGHWTAHIHGIIEYESEQDEESLAWRRMITPSQYVVGAYRRASVCQDCRNVVAEVQRRAAGLTEESLTLSNLRDIVGSSTPHATHDIDFEQAITIAISNKPLREAIEDFRGHQSRAALARRDVKYYMRLMNWSRSSARDFVGYEYKKSYDLDFDEGSRFADWLLSEAQRLEDLDEAIF